MAELWRFIINTDLTNPKEVYPSWDSSALFEYDEESGQVFKLKKFSGKLTFEEDDFDYIMNASIESQFFLDVSKRQPSGSYVVDFRGVFTRKDCDPIDEDSKRLDVQPRANNEYRLLLEGLDREFNLIDLAPAFTQMKYVVRPIFQIYTVISGQASSVLTNIYGGIQFEQEVPNPPGPILDPLTDDYHFGQLADRIVLVCDAFDPVVPTEYTTESGVFFPNYRAISLDGTHRIEYNTGTGAYDLKEISSGVTLYRLPAGSSFVNGQWASLSSGKVAESNVATFFGRMILGKDSAGAVSAEVLQEEDIVTTAEAYTHAIPVGTTGIAVFPYPTQTYWLENIIGSSVNSEEPDKYEVIDGLYFDGNYFNEPVGLGEGQIYPLQQSLWTNVSFWFQYNDELRTLESDGRTEKTLKHAYRLEDVISVVLAQLDDSLTFSRSVDNSAFLYDDENAIRTQELHTVITPKSNILIGEYNDPAKKALIKFSDILTVAAFVWKCKFDVVGSDLRIEHEEFYDRGMSYGADSVGIDYTAVKCAGNGLPWSYRTAKYNYDQTVLPGRIEFAWMDSGSRPFDGYAIDIISKQVDQSNTKTENASRFFADIDFALINPESISKDGFFFFECISDAGELILPIVELSADNETFFAQNGYAALIYCHEQYHRYQMPATNVRINNAVTTALSVLRSRMQDFDGPSDIDFNVMQLITTTLGNGRIKSMRERLDQGGITMKIAHKD